MVSVFRICYVFIPLALSIAAAVIGAFAIAGSTTHKSPVGGIYLIRLNLTEINLSSVVGSQLTISASTLGLSDIYSFGLWGYCKGSNNENNDYSVEWCSDPKAMYIFDPVDTFTQELGNTGQEIRLPEDVENYLKTAKIVSKVIFITSIAGVALSLLAAIFTLFSFCSKAVSCCSFLVGILASVSLLVASAASTGVFLLVRNQFNEAVDDFGISATLKNYHYYILIWVCAALTVLAVFFNMFAICCGSTRSSPSYAPAPAPVQPTMVYTEKRDGL